VRDPHFANAISKTIELLKSRHVVFEDGLSDGEVASCEEQFGFRFPPDLKAFLQTALPVSVQSDRTRSPFPRWRSEDRRTLQARFDWPFEGMAFDIEHNSFWLDDWGPKPGSAAEAVDIARRYVVAAPTLIPIYSHRFLPSEPLVAGNPVFSVHQTDIIIYGIDLWDYFWNEFAPESERWAGTKGMSEEEFVALVRRIRFWSTLVE
jgi:hypothetical protein